MKYYLYFLLPFYLIVILPAGGNAQTTSVKDVFSQKIDSVKDHITDNPNQPATALVEDNLNIALYALQAGTQNDALVYLEKTDALIQKMDSKVRVDFIRRSANYWNFLNNFDKALALADLGIDDAMENKDSVQLGAFYQDKALYYTFAHGNIYTKKAEELLLKSLSCLPNKSALRAEALYRLAETYYGLGNLDSAAIFHDELYLIQDSLPSTEINSLKIIEFTAKENFVAVDSMLLDQLEVYYEMEWGARIAFQYALLSQNSVKLEKYNEAIERGLKGYDYAVENELTKERADLLSMLITVYELTEDYKNALYCTKELDSIQNSFENVSEQLEQKDIQKNEALEETQKEKLINEKKTLELDNKQKQQYMLFGGIGVFILLSLFAYRAYRQKRKDHILIDKQKKLVEKQRDEVELQKTQIEEAHREITDSINYAERIQRSFLASEELLSQNLQEYFVFFQPKEAVSGDFYWARKMKGNRFAILNADSTGHGVPGAIMSIVNVSSIEWSVDQGIEKPADIFNNARKIIIDRLKKDGSAEGGKDGMDASLINIDASSGKMQYVAANNPIWIVRNGELIEIKGEKMPVGKHDNDAVPFQGGEIDILKGDLIYTLTDGFQDQFGGEKGKKFKIKPLKELLIKNAELPLSEQKEILEKIFNEWKSDHEQIDDVCVIGIRI